MKKSVLNIENKRVKVQPLGSSPSGITFNNAKIASNGAILRLREAPVPKNVLTNSYRKRFVKQRLPYKLPTIVKAKGDWFVKYFYELPDHVGKYKEFRVRDGINYIKDPEQKEKAIQDLKSDIEMALVKKGYNPFFQETAAIKDIEAAEERIKIKKQIMALGPALEWFIKEKARYGTVGNTLDGYRLLTGRFIKWCATKNLFRIDDVKIDDIEIFLAEHLESEEWAPRTYNNNVNTITTFFNYLSAKRKLPVNPIGLGMLERISNRAEKNKYYDQKTLDIIMPEVKKNPKLRRFILWTYYTCARGTELRGLKIKHIDADIKKISIMAETGKTGDKVGKRSIPICQELMDMINEENLLHNNLEWYVFGRSGMAGCEPSAKDHFSDAYYKVKFKLKIDFKFTIYSFKHTRVCDLLMAGFEPITVMYLTGHTDWGSFQAYIRELGAVMDKKLIGTTLTLNI